MKYRHLFIFLFLFLWIFLGFYLARAESPIWNEPIHLTADRFYQEGNFNFDPIEPPLFRRLVYFFGQKVETITGPSLTLFPYRAVVVVATGLGLCFLLWPLFSRSLFAGLLASVLFAYEPNLVAHSHYFTTDAISALVSVIAALMILSENWKGGRGLALFSLVISLAVSLKVASLALILPLLLIKLPRLGKPRAIFLLIFAFISIWATYDFRFLSIFRRFPVDFPFGGYLRALKENLLFSLRGQPLFFHETLYLHSPWTKTLAVFFLKNTLPLLLLALWAIISPSHSRGVRMRSSGVGSIKHSLLILPLVLLVGLAKPLNFGMRHLLAGQIALVLLAARVQPRSMLNWIIFTLLIIWQIASFWQVMPQPLTYANELTKRPYQIFTDSDFDWGQGLMELRSEVNRRGINNFQLAYFGNNRPIDYLTNFKLITEASQIDYLKTTIISVTCYYQCGYYRDPYFSRRPKEIIAKSFFYFP